MLFLLVAGAFAVVAPTWIICACGMGSLEDEAWLQWLVRGAGLLGAGVALYFMFVRR
jgi:hypothetical protein